MLFIEALMERVGVSTSLLALYFVLKNDYEKYGVGPFFFFLAAKKKIILQTTQT